MQRPILILVLVFGAIAALLFGVFQLLGGPDPLVVDQNTEDARPANQKPADRGTQLSGEGSGTGTKVASGPGDTRYLPNEDENSFQYDNKLVGQVIDKDKRPIAEVELVLTKVGSDEMFFVNDEVDRSGDIAGRTDKEGNFSFRNVEPRNKYRLILAHPEHSRLEIDTVPVGPQGVFTEPPIVMGKGVQLTGFVKDESGNAIPDAQLTLDGMMYSASPYDAPDRMSVKSSAEGWYVFANVPPGNRFMTVSARGFGTLTVNGLNFQANMSDLTRDVVLKTSEMISGRVVGPNGQPIQGARLMAVGFNSSTQTTRAIATSDAKGEFLLEALLPGMYNVLATARGYRFDKAMRVQSNTSGIVFEGFREADICGTVVDAETGKPVTDFTVRLRITYPGNAIAQPMPETSTPTKNANGEFCLVGVHQSGDGGYLVEAIAPGYAPAFSEMLTVQTGKNIQGLTLRLTHGGTLRGRIVDGSGKPVARALVTTHDNTWTDDAFMIAVGEEFPTNATTRSGRTNADGYFQVQNLTPEIYKITVQAAGYTGFEAADFQVNAGSETDTGELRLLRGGTLKGVLNGPDGRPLAGGAISMDILDGDHPVNYRAKTGVDGSFLVSNVQPGRYRLHGSSSGNGVSNPFEDIMQKKSSEQQITLANEETVNVVVNILQ